MMAAKSPIYEVWELRRPRHCPTCKQCINTGERSLARTPTLSLALNKVNWKRRLIRIRTFYSRQERRRIVQILCGRTMRWGSATA